jgi:CO/xanthine dehydrogenase FAD-binding subunit
LLVALELPSPGEASGSSYVRLEYRRHMEIAVVGAGAYVRFGSDGRVVEARVAMTALAPTVRLVPEAGEALVGTLADPAAIALAGDAVAAASTPISDVRGSADYRRAMAAVITRRAIGAAVARAKGVEVRIPASDSTFGGVQ